MTVEYFSKENAARMGKILVVLGVVLVAFVGMLFVNQMKAFNTGTDVINATTLDVSGTGIAFAIPNIANESFTVTAKAATVHDAQDTITKKANDAIAFLKSSGIADKDIQTTDYRANPEYSYPNPCAGKLCTLDSSTPKLVGYTVSETVSVKVRDTSKVGAIVDGLGSRGVIGLSGPNFSVDNTDEVNAQARAKAIADAKTKADVLAKQLGVTLVRIVRFSEGGNNVYPMAYASKDMAQSSAASAPSIEVGQNKYTSNVTITYEIQ
jgi:uncharacterized protein YggE